MRLARPAPAPRTTPLIVALLFCASLLSVPVRAQATDDVPALRVQVLSGKTGRPIANQHLTFLNKDGGPLSTAASTPIKRRTITDGEGYAAIPALDASITELSIIVDYHHPCSKAERHTFELAKVHASGLVSENACRTRITMYPQPGTLIFFVRSETFFEKLLR